MSPARLLSLLILFAAIAGSLLWEPASAQAPAASSQKPQLRIEAGFHSAVISNISLSSDGRLLATASDDKTARLWSLPEGKLLHTFRVPIGPLDEGQVWSVALSPDGTILAAGGRSQIGLIYIFDARTGQILRSLFIGPGIVPEMQFSPDGKRLAAGGDFGARIWDTATWMVEAQSLTECGNPFGIAFDSKGRLAMTATGAASVCLYDDHLKFVSRAKTPGGQMPYRIAFSPDGRKLAFGYHDAKPVDVFDTNPLRYLFSADTSNLTAESVVAVAWSADGEYLYGASGNIVRWKNGGRGPLERVAELPSNCCLAIRSHGKRGLAFGAYGPALGLLDDEAKLQLLLQSNQPNMKEQTGRNFAISRDARRVRFGLGKGGDDAWVFDLNSLSLSPSPQYPNDLQPADTTSLNIEGWRNAHGGYPRLDGKSLPPVPGFGNVHFYSLAIARGLKNFVLGTEWHLASYDSTGKPRWNYPAPGPAMGTNISLDEKFVVAAYDDGTIRWHRLSDGQELLALFVNTPREPNASDPRWVIWTPSGYYAASIGGERLIGWHVNRGRNEVPDFFPVDRFRDRFYRSDIIHHVLVMLDETKAIAEADRLANAERQERELRKLLPPVVEIISPRDGDSFSTPNLALEYLVRSPTGEKISGIDVYLDDQKLGARGFVPVADANKDAAKLDLVLPRRNVQVTLVVRSGEKASDPRTVQLNWAGPASEPKPQPRLLALLVGVSRYQQQGLELSFAHQDALNLDAALKAQEGRAFLQVESKVLVNADSNNIRKGFDWLNETAREGDLILILLSGHGTTRNNTFFFLPAEADPTNLSATTISGHEIVGVIQGLPGGKILLIDACRAGGGLVPVGMSKVPVDMNKLANDMGQPVGAIFFGSSNVGEYSYEDSKLKAGAFTAALIEGLSGKADLNGDGKIETDEMGVWLRKRVPELTEQKQHPLRHQSAPVDYTMAVE